VTQRLAAANIYQQKPDTIVESLMADPDKAAKVWWTLGERLGLLDQRQKQQGYKRIENDKAAGWDAWHGKLAWLDGLSFEDELREGPTLLNNFDDWLDQVQGITPSWKKHVTPL
jgi:hypothetical protein